VLVKPAYGELLDPSFIAAAERLRAQADPVAAPDAAAK
jgi:hypothetical protein